MDSKLQGSSEIVVAARPEAVWAILEDSRANLPRMWPMVESCEIEGKERIDALRTCRVQFMGRSGHTVERCIESVPEHRLAHSIEEDSFGFSDLLSDFWFAFILEPAGNGGTLVRVESHFDPTGLKGRIMTALMIKRQFRQVRETALANLKRLAEAASVGGGHESARLPAGG